MSNINSLIDFSRYRSAELFESIKSVCTFPAAAAFNVSMLPILATVCSVIVSIVLIFLLNAPMLPALLMFAYSFTIVPVWAFVWGMWRTGSRLVEDSAKLFSLSLQTMERVGEELYAGSSEQRLAKITPQQVLSAVNKAVILPLLVHFLAEKLPFVGERLANRVYLALAAMTESSISTDKSEGTARASSMEIINFSQRAQKNVDSIRQSAENRLLSPLRTSFIVVSVIFLALLALVAYLYIK